MERLPEFEMVLTTKAEQQAALDLTDEPAVPDA